jgi:hypothetical protein
MRRAHRVGFCLIALALVAIAPAAAQGYRGYPYTIMTPEPGTASSARGAHHRAKSHEQRKLSTKSYRRGHRSVARGSSGSVLPTPLPRTTLIPPEGNSVPLARPLPQEQGPTILPSGRVVPNLPHGPETFQDRASRCAMQQGLFRVPNIQASQYMHACAM